APGRLTPRTADRGGEGDDPRVDRGGSTGRRGRGGRGFGAVGRRVSERVTRESVGPLAGQVPPVADPLPDRVDARGGRRRTRVGLVRLPRAVPGGPALSVAGRRRRRPDGGPRMAS